MNREQLIQAYQARYDNVLGDIVVGLDAYIRGLVSDAKRIDRVSVRAKDPNRFVNKAFKTAANDDQKYSDPLNEIQDQIGARITVFYLSDVQKIKSLVLEYFTAIEIAKKEPERAAEFGYFGEHFILKIPADVMLDGVSDSPEFFELQIKTLFQHAWSEADHDLAYKSIRALEPLEQREIALSAAQAWGADRIFEELAQKLVPGMTGD